MKKFYILVLVAILFAGCEKKEQKEVSIAQENVSTPQIKIVENALEVKENNPLISYDIDGKEKLNIQTKDDEEAKVVKQIAAQFAIKNSYAKVSKELLGQRLSK
ncbi:MAG: hypothetical protein ACK5LP_00360, partial [Campylobacteraceae bacterium]